MNRCLLDTFSDSFVQRPAWLGEGAATFKVFKQVAIGAQGR